MKKTIILILSIFLGFYAQVQAQDPGAYRFDESWHWRSNRLANTREGLWIAGDTDIFSFDRTSETWYSVNLFLEINRHDTINFVTVDSSDRLWYGLKEHRPRMFDGEVHYYENLKMPSFVRIFYDLMPLDEDRFYTAGQAFHHYDASAGINTYFGGWMYSGCQMAVTDIAMDSKGGIWATATYGGKMLSHIDVTTESVTYYTLKWYEGVSTLVIDQEDNIWTGSRIGLIHFDTETKKYQEFNYLKNPEIPKGFYSASDKDEKHNLWFSCADHLVKYDGSTFTSYTCPEYKEARSILCDKDIVWILTRDQTLLRFDKGEFKAFQLVKGTGIATTDADAVSFKVSQKAQEIDISGEVGISEVALYNLSGTLLSSQLFASERAVQFDHDGLANGIYILKIRHEKGESVIKLKI
ncbi:MAG: T9SS type A sorting domain-containing protein [Bacteroidales bacterium]